MISLVRGRKVSNFLRAAFADIDVENMWRSYFCISTNLTTGQSHTHRRGPLWRAIRASIALPGLLPPVVEDGQILVDGGMIDNLPADVMKSQRRGPVIGVDVGRDLGLTASATELDDKSLWWLLRHSRTQVPSIGSLLVRAATVSGDAQGLAQKSGLDLLLVPDLDAYDFLNWKGYDEAFEKGFSSTMKALEQLDDSLLKTLTGSN
jgi:NTE family protein